MASVGGIRDYFGKCLVGGNHTPGTEAWRECPLRNAKSRSERAGKASRARWARLQAPLEHKYTPEAGFDAPAGDRGLK